MGAHSSMLHVRIDNEVKAKAIAALEAMGLSASDAVPVVDRNGRLFGLVTLWHFAELAAAQPTGEG